MRATISSADNSDVYVETFVSSGPPPAPAATAAPHVPRRPARHRPFGPRLPRLSRRPAPRRRRPAGGSKTLDQVIVDYLASEAASERLELSIMAGADFVSGGTVPLTVIATTSLSRKPVPGAQVTIRVVSTSGPPQVLYRGLTGNDGMVKTSCALPEIGGANAALIIVGFSSIGSSEVEVPRPEEGRLRRIAAALPSAGLSCIFRPRLRALPGRRTGR